MVKCKYEGTGIWSGRCIGTKEVDPCTGYDKCKQYKPNYTTNADRIRAMTDDELADFMNRDISGCPPTGDCNKASDDCKACWLDWLQQLAE